MSEQQRSPDNGKRGIAFYYPGPMWSSAAWIKNLLLFFDGVGLLVPAYMKDRPEYLDPSIVAALNEHKLLHILEPETLVDKPATEKLATAMTDIITSGALDSLAHGATHFHALSYSRLGSYGDPGLAKMILDELKSRGLARDSEDGVSIPMHPQVRALVLVLLAQILRAADVGHDVELSPATDRPQLVAALDELLSVPTLPSAGHVISLDLQTVGVDLSMEPIDEILDFRKAHLDDYRAYARAVRGFVRELGLLPEDDRARALQERQEELSDMAHSLREISRGAWGRAATFTFGFAGAAWTLRHGLDPIGALFAAGMAASALVADESNVAGAYTYIFQAQRRYP